jgi:hypothetical protein
MFLRIKRRSPDPATVVVMSPNRCRFSTALEPAMARERSDRRLDDRKVPVGVAGHDVHDQYHRIPAPRLRAIVASRASAVVKRARFAFTIDTS